MLVACALLVCATFLLINASFDMYPQATTYSGLLTASLGRKWALAYDVWIVVVTFGTVSDERQWWRHPGWPAGAAFACD